MLKDIPTHVITGPLGAGKTTVIRQLMAQRPADERWAVLINEFGQIGLDAALLTTDQEGIALAEVAGGCLCCVNGAPFQVGLGRLLRKARPHRLFIEPSGLGHPLQLLAQLRQAPWKGVLAVQPGVMVLDAQALACGQLIPEAQQLALPEMGLLVLNKSQAIEEEKRLWINKLLPADTDLIWTEQGKLAFSTLPESPVDKYFVASKVELPTAKSSSPIIWTDTKKPIVQSYQQGENWSIGWCWHPSQSFDLAKIQAWIERLEWCRAKMVIHSPQGWYSANALDRQALNWQPSEWRKDSRLELIFSYPQDAAVLETDFLDCRQGPV
ncbi:GTP-binding protein [Pseudomonas sp. R5(2019)]|uniref:CobW family GTP-binding protein n=1 Tax=Pseudomonas sp. R5(2019) TaxID=2697566 RepID=UPI001411EE5A|nr:CobW-like GTP-binding protein [Pseudomonas sp. R5(2019)]NBA97055.1 cobalamin biosynthesis protein CobW [Pseudomonas sp. R5(2019)]